MQKKKVLVADPISEKGIDELRATPELDVTVRIGIKPDELLACAHEFEGIVVRSQTKITAEVFAKATALKAVGRAGVGVDNIDVAAANRQGVIVMNTPAGNTISTAEHTFTLLMSMARSIPQAHASVSSGKWERKNFEGVELNGKVLAVIGMGRIGSEVARRAMAFGMRVLAYDPYLSPSRAHVLRVELMSTVEDAIREADFITVHMPLTKETKYLLNRERIALCKRGVRLVNCARGGLIEEAALVEALSNGHVAGAALDVFETEPPAHDNPLLTMPNVVLTPHLGASTFEAQESVGIEIARAIRDALVDGIVSNAVNMPSVDRKTLDSIGGYLGFAEKLGRLAGQLAPKQPDMLRVNYSGPVGEGDTTLISRAVLKGYLDVACSEGSVNWVNAPGVAESLGLSFTETRLAKPADFTELIEVTAGAGSLSASVAGTFFGKHPRIVGINGNRVEAEPAGCLLIYENKDQPGIVGAVGTILGQFNVNIANMSLSRDATGGKALVLLTLDTCPEDHVVEELLKHPAILSARILRV
ncbi:MAG: phosphoglycerate dehydrogenase [Verrucomicrobiaceae bacterium]|nr:MAG: phosphoglycerate dehydrogenase [Verrucomicrobiaceae bacterium]